MKLRSVDGIPVVEVDGEIDLVNIGELNERLCSAAERDTGAVIISLAGSTYFDSATLHALLMCRLRLSTGRQRLLIVTPSTHAGRRILEIAGLARPDILFESLDDAVKIAVELVADRSEL